jgi:hypothetical protein
MVRALQFTAIGAFGDTDRGDEIMRTAHVAAGLGGFLLGNGHNTTRIEWDMRRPNPLAKAVSIKQNAGRGKVPTAPPQI